MTKTQLPAIPSDQTSATVYVSLDSHGDAQFNLDNGDTWYAAPITWNPSAANTTPLTITFQLVNGGGGTQIDGITPFLVMNGLVATVQSRKGQDAFLVDKSDGTFEDPKIVVTPQ